METEIAELKDRIAQQDFELEKDQELFHKSSNAVEELTTYAEYLETIVKHQERRIKELQAAKRMSDPLPICSRCHSSIPVRSLPMRTCDKDEVRRKVGCSTCRRAGANFMPLRSLADTEQPKLLASWRDTQGTEGGQVGCSQPRVAAPQARLAREQRERLAPQGQDTLRPLRFPKSSQKVSLPALLLLLPRLSSCLHFPHFLSLLRPLPSPVPRDFDGADCDPERHFGGELLLHIYNTDHEMQSLLTSLETDSRQADEKSSPPSNRPLNQPRTL
eukprot:745708-Hanusia_phi.AAC.4